MALAKHRIVVDPVTNEARIELAPVRHIELPATPAISEATQSALWGSRRMPYLRPPARRWRWLRRAALALFAVICFRSLVILYALLTGGAP